MTGRIFDSSVI